MKLSTCFRHGDTLSSLNHLLKDLINFYTIYMSGHLQLYTPTTLADWRRSDTYHNSFLIPKDEILDTVLKNSVGKGFPDIAVSTAQGKFLNLLVRSLGAKRVLEVGTLGG